jgi:hypothetical protein
MKNILLFSHNRKDKFKNTSDLIFSLIDQFGNQDKLSILYNYYQRRFGIPEKILKQQLKRTISPLYVYKER